MWWEVGSGFLSAQTMLFLPSVAHAFWSLLDIWHTFQSPFWLQARPERVPQRTKRVATAQWPENGCSVPVWVCPSAVEGTARPKGWDDSGKPATSVAFSPGNLGKEPAPWMGLFNVGILMELSKFTAEQRCGCGSKPNCFPKCVAIHIPTKGIFWQHVWIQICAHSPPCWCKASFFLISFGYCNPPFFWYTA